MKISEAKIQHQQQQFHRVEIRRNPGQLDEWFVLLYADEGRSHSLIDRDEIPISRPSVDDLIEYLGQIGCSEASIIF